MKKDQVIKKLDSSFVPYSEYTMNLSFQVDKTKEW